MVYTIEISNSHYLVHGSIKENTSKHEGGDTDATSKF